MGRLSENFLRSEFTCGCGCGFDTVDAELLAVLVDLRAHFGARIKVTSGARCPTHNANEGGGKNSQHLYGRAADVKVDGVAPIEVQEYLDQKYKDRYGLGSYGTFTHIDTRTRGPARWVG